VSASSIGARFRLSGFGQFATPARLRFAPGQIGAQCLGSRGLAGGRGGLRRGPSGRSGWIVAHRAASLHQFKRVGQVIAMDIAKNGGIVRMGRLRYIPGTRSVGHAAPAIRRHQRSSPFGLP